MNLETVTRVVRVIKQTVELADSVTEDELLEFDELALPRFGEDESARGEHTRCLRAFIAFRRAVALKP